MREKQRDGEKMSKEEREREREREREIEREKQRDGDREKRNYNYEEGALTDEGNQPRAKRAKRNTRKER